ncbi:MAG: hypothetical protein JXQ72_07020 [Anaerolineae bacterium]|nr:hypothetical protein [Anaerolineae bacterium]
MSSNPVSDLRERLEQASRLIRAKRYDEARALLETIPHPQAQEWLAKLDTVAPRPAPEPEPEPEPQPKAVPAPVRPAAPPPPDGSPQLPPGQQAKATGVPPASMLAGFVLLVLGAFAAFAIAVIQFIASSEAEGFDLLLNLAFAANTVTGLVQIVLAMQIFQRKPGAIKAANTLLFTWIVALLVGNVLILLYVTQSDKFAGAAISDNPVYLGASLGAWIFANALAMVALGAAAPDAQSKRAPVKPFAISGEPISPAIKPYHDEKLLGCLPVHLETPDHLNKAAGVDLLITNYRLILWQSARSSKGLPGPVFERLVKRLGLVLYDWTPDGANAPRVQAHRLPPGCVSIPYDALTAFAPDEANEGQFACVFQDRRGQAVPLLMAFDGSDSADIARLLKLMDYVRAGQVPGRLQPELYP